METESNLSKTRGSFSAHASKHLGLIAVTHLYVLGKLYKMFPEKPSNTVSYSRRTDSGGVNSTLAPI